MGGQFSGACAGCLQILFFLQNLHSALVLSVTMKCFQNLLLFLVSFIFFTLPFKSVDVSSCRLWLSFSLLRSCVTALPFPLRSTPTHQRKVQMYIDQSRVAWREKKRERVKKKPHTAPNKEPAPVIHLTKSRLWEVLRGSSGPARVIRTQILLYVIHQT